MYVDIFISPYWRGEGKPTNLHDMKNILMPFPGDVCLLNFAGIFVAVVTWYLFNYTGDVLWNFSLFSIFDLLRKLKWFSSENLHDVRLKFKSLWMIQIFEMDL